MSYRCPECPVTGSKSNVRAHQLLEAHFGEPVPTKKPTDLQVLAAKYIEAVEQWKVLDAQEPTPSKDLPEMSSDEMLDWLEWNERAAPKLRVVIDLARLFAERVGSESTHQFNLLPIAQRIIKGEQQ